MTKNIGHGVALRVCDLCGGVDDHPRHVVIGPPDTFAIADGVLDKVLEVAPVADRARLVRDLMDTASSDRHYDCCREAGCPNGLCGRVTAGAETKRGAALLGHLQSVGDIAPDDDSTVQGVDAR